MGMEMNGDFKGGGEKREQATGERNAGRRMDVRWWSLGPVVESQWMMEMIAGGILRTPGQGSFNDTTI